jgi:cardiolipin synthase
MSVPGGGSENPSRNYHPHMPSSHIPSIEEGPYPVRAGNRVQPLIGGETAFRRICEAVEEARHSVWVTVAFLESTFEFPDARGHLFDVLDRAVERGLDVRALFWRSPEAWVFDPGSHFLGSEEDHVLLADRGARFLARWDRLDKTYCHHQKSWLIDAGRGGEVVFVGGINLDNDSVTKHPFPLREGESVAHTQDVYCELAGPVATDVHHNFVQRWNGASERALPFGAWPAPERVDDLAFPKKVSIGTGGVPVQLSRTIRRGFYEDDTAPPGGRVASPASGEYGVMHQYVAAIGAAREAIYFENQLFFQPDIFDALESALARGVRALAVVPANPSMLVAQAREAPQGAALFERLVRLAEDPSFSFVGLAVDRGGFCEPVYVHTKVAIIDDVWATIGSSNIWNRSFFGDTELNASFWHAETARRFRVELLSAHNGDDLSSVSMTAALDALAKRAGENYARQVKGESIRGHVIELDAATWGVEPG